VPARRVTRHTRLQRGLGSAARRARQEKKLRRQEKLPSGRPRAYQEHQVSGCQAPGKLRERAEPGPRDWSPRAPGW
jgi:hypothetical protein